MKKSWFVIAAAIPLVVVGSLAVWQLSGSGERRVGALGPIEEPMPLAWRGEWTPEGKYEAGHVVSYEGASYVAEEPNSDAAPVKEGPWALLTAMGGSQGTEGPQGAQGPPGPQGAQGPQGPPGSGIASLDQLRGLPCNIGQRGEGTVSVGYDLSTETTTFRCNPTNLVRLTVEAIASLEGTSEHTMTISGSEQGGALLGNCYDGVYGSVGTPTVCRWWVTKNATVTLTGSTGSWSGACTGTASSCSVVMSGDRSVTKRAS